MTIDEILRFGNIEITNNETTSIDFYPNGQIDDSKTFQGIDFQDALKKLSKWLEPQAKMIQNFFH